MQGGSFTGTLEQFQLYATGRVNHIAAGAVTQFFLNVKLKVKI